MTENEIKEKFKECADVVKKQVENLEEIANEDNSLFLKMSLEDNEFGKNLDDFLDYLLRLSHLLRL